MIALLWALACRQEPATGLSPDEILDPANCAECHPTHVARWEASTHAHAGVDPVFRAMNARGQRETNGELGDFCVRCHAPVALAAGLTTDGTNLDELPDHLTGVTCAWCHRVEEVTGAHNAALEVDAGATTLRAGIIDPRPNRAHPSAYSPLHDRDAPTSSDMCGACHDVVLDSGLHLERTYLQWQESVFSGSGLARQSCGACHMRRSLGQAAEGGPERNVHDHLMPAVGVTLLDSPYRATQLEAVDDALAYALLPTLCVKPAPAGSEVALTLENVAAGHRFPSGAAHDRRVWVELVATDAGGEVLLSTGVIGDDEALVDVIDPNRWELHDLATDGEGHSVHMFWAVEAIEERTLPVATTNDPSKPGFVHSVTRTWPIPGAVPTRVEARVLLRPLGYDLIDDLIASGDLDPTELLPVPTFDIRGAEVVWEGVPGECR